MKRDTIFFLLAICIALVAVSCSDRRPTAKDPDAIAKDQNQANQQHITGQQKDYSSYLVDVVQDQLFEIELGKLGKRKSNSDKIQDFAAELEKHHQNRLKKLNSLANDFAYMMPHNLSDKQWEEIKDLEKTNAKNFDEKWIDAVISNHNNAADVLIKSINKVDNNKIRTQLNETLQEVRSHLEAATYIKNQQLK